jgi:HAMP domain-containing protein
MKYFFYALGVKLAITGVVLYVLWRRRQQQLEELAANDTYALDYLK